VKEKWLCRCDLCAQERRKGDLCYRIEGNTVCPECLPVFAQRHFRWALEIL
jgi:hypothetical protein